MVCARIAIGVWHGVPPAAAFGMDLHLVSLPGAAKNSGYASCGIPSYLHPPLGFKLKGCGQIELVLRFSYKGRDIGALLGNLSPSPSGASFEKST